MTLKKILLMALVSVAAASQALVIDDFTTGAASNSINAGSLVTSQTGTMIGGERDLGMVVQSNPLNTNLQMTIGSGMYITSSGTLLDGQVGLDYDGVGDETDASSPFENGPGFSPVNLSGLADRFRLNFLANDLSLTANILVVDSIGGVSQATSSVAGSQIAPFSQDVMLSSFVGAADMSSISRMIFIFETSPSGDFAMSSIEAVPEPATMAILGIGAATFLRRRRK